MSKGRHPFNLPALSLYCSLLRVVCVANLSLYTTAMFWMSVFLFVSYNCLLSSVVGLHFLLRRLRVKLVWRLSLYLLIALLPFVPYVIVAIQTAKYRAEILPALRASAIHWGDPKQKYFILRILSITPSRANVYVVTSCQGGMGTDPKTDKVGMLVTLNRTSKGWEFADYDAAWSDCGSADGNTFPPYPEAQEF